VELTAAGVGTVAALVLALSFLLAGVLKLRMPAATRDAFRALGVPRAATAARIVPLTELALGILLVVVPRIGAVLALATLAVFTAFLGDRLRRGVATPCNCFGARSARPLSQREIVRNLTFVVLALLALLAPRPVMPTLLDVVVVAGVVATCAIGRWLVLRALLPEAAPA
jgi:uncharacterized membrane protein YphA (DoxX/SURF4 family)